MSTPRLARNNDFPEAIDYSLPDAAGPEDTPTLEVKTHWPGMIQHRDTADERPVMQDNAQDLRVKRPYTEDSDAALPSQLLGPTEPIEYKGHTFVERPVPGGIMVEMDGEPGIIVPIPQPEPTERDRQIVRELADEAAVQRGMATVRRLLDAHEAGEYPEYHPAGTGQRIIELEARVAELEAERARLVRVVEAARKSSLRGVREALAALAGEEGQR